MGSLNRLPSEHHHVFGTCLGPCGIAWSERGVTRLQLPERTRSATERRLRARPVNSGTGVPPVPVRDAIAMLERYFAGERVDFASVALDLGGVGPVADDVREGQDHESVEVGDGP
jgi:methylated-DNA-[protein]-cysteine S-methyltransferase